MFDLLEKKVDKALEVEYETGDSFHLKNPDVEHSTFYGFALPAELALTEARTKHLVACRQRIDEYRDHALKLRTRLATANITPLAVITFTAWRKILIDKGLFVVRPSSDSRVRVNRDRIKELRSNAVHPHSKLALRLHMGIGTAIAVALTPLVWGLGYNVENGFVSALSSALTAVLIMLVGVAVLTGIAAASWDNFLTGKAKVNALKKFAKEASHEEMLHFLAIRYGSSLPYFDGEQQYGYRIELPEPPARVFELLKRLQTLNPTDFRLSIAAEPSAIHFKDDWSKILNQEVQRMEWEEQQAARDPILYVQFGNAVAILDQYGDGFTLEEAAIDAVVNSEHLL